ncbi:MAG: hypothetical protein WDZ69_03170 [Candidatus Pacearchaeota archaeon]
MKRGLALISLSLILVLSVGIVSAGWFSDFFGITGSATDDGPEEDLTPRVAFWQGKVNQHFDVESGEWNTDPDGVSGAELGETEEGRIEYCEKFYGENVTASPEYKMETIEGWKDRGNVGDYTSEKQSYECVVEEERVEVICSDSDGGINYYVKGSVSGNLGVKNSEENMTYPEYCLDNQTLIERYCGDSQTNFTEEYKCPNGCYDGACLGLEGENYSLQGGQSMIISLGDIKYTLELRFVGHSPSKNSDVASFFVRRDPESLNMPNPEFTNYMSAGESQTLSDGNVVLSVHDVVFQEYVGGIKKATFSLFREEALEAPSSTKIIDSYGEYEVKTGDIIRFPVGPEALIAITEIGGVRFYYDLSVTNITKGWNELNESGSRNLPYFPTPEDSVESFVDVSVESINIVRDGNENSEVENSNSAVINLELSVPEVSEDKIIAEDIGEGVFSRGAYLPEGEECSNQVGGFNPDEHCSLYFAEYSYPSWSELNYPVVGLHIIEYSEKIDSDDFIEFFLSSVFGEGAQVGYSPGGTFVVEGVSLEENIFVEDDEGRHYISNGREGFVWTHDNKILSLVLLSGSRDFFESEAVLPLMLAYTDKYPSDLQPTANVSVEDCLNSCELEGSCVPIGYRSGEEYCGLGYDFIPQSGEGQQCENNFECDSNLCLDGECVSGGLIQRILGWFRNRF